MVFNTRAEYHRERRRLERLNTSALEELLGNLYQKRYDDQDISYESYHRLASSVYTQRKMDSKQLVFHMKKFMF
jgi:hypothetical protein